MVGSSIHLAFVRIVAVVRPSAESIHHVFNYAVNNDVIIKLNEVNQPRPGKRI